MIPVLRQPADDAGMTIGIRTLDAGVVSVIHQACINYEQEAHACRTVDY
jgi:hypothetical protein